jgi:trans-aconitate methyltransferase
MDRKKLALPRDIAARYRGHALRGYARGKLASDPVYEAVRQRVQPTPRPLLDVGCGIGLGSLYLQQAGYPEPIHGIDPDDGKIKAALQATGDLPQLTFEVADATDSPLLQSLQHSPGHVVMLDVLHYLTESAQQRVLSELASMIPPAGWCILRATPCDSSLRFRLTRWEERFARSVRWMRRSAVHFPSQASVTRPFAEAGFECEVRPLWGRTPFNSYQFAFRRPS